MSTTTPSPLPWRVGDAHGLCIVDADGVIVADLTPRSDWAQVPSNDRLRANADAIIDAVTAWMEDAIAVYIPRHMAPPEHDLTVASVLDCPDLVLDVEAEQVVCMGCGARLGPSASDRSTD